MSIEIVVRDPANTSPADLKLVITLLQRFAGGQVQAVIGAPDLPDVGALNGDDAAEAFNAGAQPANVAFGGAAAATPEQAFAPSAGPNGAPPPPPNGAPPAPANGSSTVGASAQLDSAGLPWDPRIHAKTGNGGGKINQTGGRWSAKRGVDANLVATVEAELRALMAAPAPAGVPVGYVEAPFPPAAVPNGAPPPPPPMTTFASPAASAVTAPVSAGPAAATSYPQLVQAAGTAMAAGKLTMDEVTAACVKWGVPDMTLIPQRVEFLPFIAGEVMALIASRG